MRPLRLTIRGLRSYRGECIIDFGDRGLIAIVGDTGAGKSSVLEAITYALYNATTWDQRAVTQLVSDGAQSMSVELDFRVLDRVWSVHRACHRSSGRPSTHRLRCLSDLSAEEYDGEATVNRQVERLLGMTYKAYLAAVVLPQGRFQTLLQETRARRTEILEGIFRLTDLRRVRDAARELAQRANVAIERLVGRRGALLLDPAGEAKALEQTLASVERDEKALVVMRKEAERTVEAEREAGRRVATLRQVAERLSRLDTRVGKRLADLVPLAAAIEAELTAAAEQEAEIGDRERTAAAAIAEAARVGQSLEDLVAASQLLHSTRQLLADLEVAAQSAKRERAEIDDEAAFLMAAERSLPELEAAWRTCNLAADETTTALEEQREALRRVAEALRAAREAAVSREAAVVGERECEETVPGLHHKLNACEHASQEAETMLGERRDALEEARRQDAAAHASQGLRPGDTCPICGVVLGAGFKPLPATALMPLERAARDAEEELARCRSNEMTAKAQLDEAKRRLEEAVDRRKAAEQAVELRLAALAQILPGADLQVQDVLLLRPIDARVKSLASAAATRATQAQEAWGRLQRAQAEVTAGQSALRQRRLRLEQEENRIRGQGDSCNRQLRSLPPTLSVPLVSRAEDLDEVTADTERRLEVARGQRGELDSLRGKLGKLAETRLRLQRQRHDEVEMARSGAMRGATELLMRINDALQAVGRPVIAAAEGGMALDDEARWAGELDHRAAGLQRQLNDEIGATELKSGAESDVMARKLGEAGFSDADALNRQLRQLSQDIGIVRGKLNAARAQIAEATDLDGRIAFGREIRDSLSELVRLLQDGQFVGFVIDRLQRQLLIVASEILASMTGRRYGFSPDFDIVDRFSSQPRPTRTLSGGETFLASLALALALVEIAARSGTQLDALFLDEGFGSLDADALDDALSALERRASGGRLVAVVSHIRAVAERIETVLEVTRTATGSRAEWRGPTEREQMLAEEFETGLLA